MQTPSLAQIEATRERLGDMVLETPVWHWQEPDIQEIVGDETQVMLKLELFQRTGSFKPRGALAVMLDLDKATLAKGVTAVSAGNHAIAVAFAARFMGTSAKVVMPKTASPFRVARCRAYGAEVILVKNVQEAFAKVEQIRTEEERALVHPFEGPLTALGTATVGLEFCRQVPEMDAVIIPIGGGGLIAGMATAIKAIRPQCQVFGVEPYGANTMSLSLAVGSPQSIEKVETIADSLGAPHAAPYSFELCRQAVDEVILIDDASMQRAMALLFASMKLAVEPAGAAATAALCGPLLDRLRGKRVGVIVCGSNLDIDTFARHVAAGMPNATNENPVNENPANNV
jgi:threonine dehydratase